MIAERQAGRRVTAEHDLGDFRRKDTFCYAHNSGPEQRAIPE
jgi:hypothetical protein